ncbi:MAG: GSU2403 family nucleotidyltransferase fold protein [Hyphomicrobiaceae bacterium]
MKPIPLSLLTLYADLEQNVGPDTIDQATISRRLVGGTRRLYADIRRGEHREQRYLGTVGDVEAEALAERFKNGAAQARQRRKTITLLKRAGLHGPDLATGRVLDAMAHAKLFERGAVLVGTVAYQTYAPLIGAFLAGRALLTQDADLAATRLALPRLAQGLELQQILSQADATFTARFHGDDKLPRRFASASGFIVEVLTTLGRSEAPVQIPGLGCAALPLRFMEYLIEGPVDVVVLHGTGIRVRVPDPARYAVHKLIVGQVRTSAAKRPKDLLQASQLIKILRAREPDRLDDAIDDAVERGRTWAKLVREGLTLVNDGKKPP